jgi:hypothetical protein
MQANSLGVVREVPRHGDHPATVLDQFCNRLLACDLTLLGVHATALQLHQTTWQPWSSFTPPHQSYTHPAPW